MSAGSRPATRIFLHSLRSTLRGLALPMIAVLALCYLGLHSLPQQVGTGADRSAGYWLHLPGLLLVATGLAATLESWPLFSRARPGFGWLLRVQSQALHGCVAATLGGLVALSAALVVAGLSFSLMLGAMNFDLGAVHRPVAFETQAERPYLDQEHASLSFRRKDGGNVKITGVRILPQVLFRGSIDLPRIQVLADGVPLTKDWLGTSGKLIELRVEPPRPIEEITVSRQAGAGMVVYLAEGSLSAITDEVRPGYLNCVLASLSFLAPALLAFAAMVLGHAHLTLAVNLGVGLFVCLISSLLDLTPSHAAVTAFARSHWIEIDDLGLPLLWAALATGLVLALRGIVGRIGRA